MAPWSYPLAYPVPSSLVLKDCQTVDPHLPHHAVGVGLNTHSAAGAQDDRSKYIHLVHEILRDSQVGSTHDVEPLLDERPCVGVRSASCWDENIPSAVDDHAECNTQMMSHRLASSSSWTSSSMRTWWVQWTHQAYQTMRLIE